MIFSHNPKPFFESFTMQRKKQQKFFTAAFNTPAMAALIFTAAGCGDIENAQILDKSRRGVFSCALTASFQDI
jgi:hypothetical protein